MTSNHTKKALMLLILLVLGLIALYVAGFMYVRHLQSRTQELSSKIIEEERLAGQETSLKLLVKDIKPNLEVLSGFVIGREGDIEFIKALEEMGTEQSVRLQIVSAAETDQDPFKRISFNVVITGSWERVLHTVDLIESLPYKVGVTEVSFNRISIAASEDRPASSEWRAAMQFSVIKEK